MASRTPAEKAKSLGISQHEGQILVYVAHWFNGHSVSFESGGGSIGTTYEPTLERLAKKRWSPAHGKAYKKLIERGFFKSDTYIAGRRCRWAPTEKCMQAIEHILSDMENLYPDWMLDEHPRPPTFRDGSELMEHRKGTMAAYNSFMSLERCSGADVYPRISLPQRPDLRLFSWSDELAYVEVLTDHGNRESWETKFEAWSQRTSPPTLWIFPNRRLAVDFFNHLHRHGYIRLSRGEFGGQKTNWSPKRINGRLRRSHTGNGKHDSVHACWTIAGLIEAKRFDVFEFAQENNIILQS